MSGEAARQSAADSARCVQAFEQEFDYLYRLLRRQGVHQNDVEDLVQEVFTVMWRRWPEYRADLPLRPWLAGIAVHFAYKHRQRGSREIPSQQHEREGARHGEPAWADAQGTPVDDRIAARALLERTLAAIPEIHRTALVLHVLQGCSVREMAAVLAIPVATAYTRIARARRVFMDVARTLTTDRPPGQRRLLLAPASLLDLARPAEGPPPGDLRRRALGRARAHAAGTMAGAAPAPIAAACVALAVLVLVGTGQLGMPAADPLVAAARPQPAARPAPDRSRLERRLAVMTSTLVRVPALVAPTPAGPRPDGAALARGLSGYWRFDEGEGATSQDLSGHGNDCRLEGMDLAGAWASGRLSRSLRFSARGRTVCPVPAPVAERSRDSTVSLWVKRNARKRYRQTLVGREDDTRQRYFALSLQNDTLLLEAPAWRTRLQAPLPPEADRWVHVAFTFSEQSARGGQLRLFLDGTEVDAQPARASPPRAPAAFLIAGLAWDAKRGLWWQGFRGQLDELAVHHRVLGDDEIAALAASRQPQP